MVTVDFYFDFASPTAFLGYYRLEELAKKYDAKINYHPILLGALHKATGNSPPATVPAKGVYMLPDMMRFAKRYNVEMEFNPHFPINCIKPLRGAIFLQGKEEFPAYVKAMYNAVWQQKLNVAEDEVFRKILTDAGIDPDPVIAATQDEAIKEKLKTNTEEAANRGAFGAPTFYIGDEMFFGQDRLDFIEERMQGK